MPGKPIHCYLTAADLKADVFPGRDSFAFAYVAATGLIYKSVPGSTTADNGSTVLAPDSGEDGRWKTDPIEQPDVTFAAVHGALAAADSSVDFNDQALVAVGGVESDADHLVVSAKVLNKGVSLQAGATLHKGVEVLDAAGTIKVGFFGATPVVQRGAYTQTYATADRENKAATAVAVATTAPTQSTPWGFASQAQGQAVLDNVNALEADVLQMRKLLNALIDDLQALGVAT